MTVLVTGAAGFIGMHLCINLLNLDVNVLGLDNFNNYYDLNLKSLRLKKIKERKKNFQFLKIDLKDKKEIDEIFNNFNIEVVINLAAQAGVRYSIENPNAYLESNIIGFFNILEACRHNKISHLIYASSSSVYGINSRDSFNESNSSDYPISLYGASKKTNEILAHSYSHLYKIPSTGLRFFTAYGPWGRPDMAPMIFAKAILDEKPIYLFNNGNMYRDFTYIDDITQSIVKLIKNPPSVSSNIENNDSLLCSSYAPHRIFNITNLQCKMLITFLSYWKRKLIKKLSNI